MTDEEINCLNEKIYEYIYLDKPVQYILGYSYFYGMKFNVTKDTLIPRFDTERVLEEALDVINNYIKEKSLNKIDIVDIGTGSGIIAITLKKYLGNKANVDAIDISQKALEVSKTNAILNNVEVNFIENDLLSSINKKYDVIISNPPYIDKNELELSLMGSDVKKYEPALALYASDKGMHFYIEILKQSFNNLKKNGIIIFEIGYNQEYLMKDLVMKYYPNSKHYCLKDYNNNPRVYVIIN